MPILFEDWQRILAPRWLRAGLGDFWLQQLGAQKDRIEQWLRDSTLSRFPDAAAIDALQAIGADRGLERPFGDDPYQVTDAWRTKLKSAFALWLFGGTHHGLLRELRDATFGPTLPGGSYLFLFDSHNQLINRQDDVGDGFTGFSQFVPIPAEPWGLQFDDVSSWNEFVVLFWVLPGHPWYGGPPTDTSNSADQARRTITRWKAAHARCVKIVIQQASSVGQTNVLWGIDNGSGDPSDPCPAWGGYNWGQTGGAGSATTTWTPPTQ